jgi:hypothetical protein
MSAHLSSLRLFQRHLQSLVWAWVWVWDWIHWHTSPRTRSSSSRHPPFTHYPFPPRSLVCGGQPSPQKSQKPRLVVSHSTCPPLSSFPPRAQVCIRYCSNKQPQGPGDLLSGGSWRKTITAWRITQRTACPKGGTSPQADTGCTHARTRACTHTHTHTTPTRKLAREGVRCLSSNPATETLNPTSRRHQVTLSLTNSPEGVRGLYAP